MMRHLQIAIVDVKSGSPTRTHSAVRTGKKVDRLLKAGPEKGNHTHHAYGDSRGYKEMAAFSDTDTYI